jgi:hypothetical protein
MCEDSWAQGDDVHEFSYVVEKTARIRRIKATAGPPISYGDAGAING